MKIRDLLAVESIQLNGSASSKTDALNQVIDLMNKSGKISDLERYRKGVFEREEEGSTGIGMGIAIPHCKSDSVKEAGLAAYVIKDGVNFESLDGEPAKIIFLIAAPNTEDNVHLEVLSKLSVMLMDENFTKNLINANSIDEFLNIIDKTEEERDFNILEDESYIKSCEEYRKTSRQDRETIELDREKIELDRETIELDRKTSGQDRETIELDRKTSEQDRETRELVLDNRESRNEIKSPVKILAVTACPTGIAHTYMAAESLQKKAKELGYFIKVETRGSSGAKNVLTESEIKEADAIIVACDTNVPMDRFDGKKVIQCKVADGINKSEELIKKAVEGDVKLYKVNGKNKEQFMSDDNIGHMFYKHLMNGVSHMLPFVVGGGILIAISFLIDGLSVDLNVLSFDEKKEFGTITATASLFKEIGDIAFGFMLPVFAGFIAMSIADRPGLAVGFVGGSIANNGTSGFLGALVAGFLGGYIVLGLRKVFNKLPDSLDGLKPVLLYPLIGIFLTGVIMQFVVEPPIGALNILINNSLKELSGTSAVLLGALLGGMMSVDMGGPVNKAAYVFGTASITSGNYNIMAAVMIGGMVPPIAIALATLLFKDKFTEDQRKAGVTNFIMGLSFITEGAIPFAAADPFRVIPCCVIGSAISGAFSMAFHCTLMAPHGGIFVVPTIGNFAMYLVALIIGSVVSSLLLGILKMDVK